MSDILKYEIEIRLPHLPLQRIPIDKKVILGSDQSCDVPLVGQELAPKQCQFNISNGILNFQNLSKLHSMQLDGKDIGPGKKYILDVGDRLSINGIEFIVREHFAHTTPVNAEGLKNIDSLFNSSLTLSGEKESSLSRELEEEFNIDGVQNISIQHGETATHSSHLIADHAKMKLAVNDTSDEDETIILDENSFLEDEETIDRRPRFAAFFSKFFHRLGKENKPPKMAIQFKKKKAYGPGPLSRVMAFLAQLALCLALFQYVGRSELRLLSENIFLALAPFFKTIGIETLNTDLISLYLSYWIIELLFVSLLGVSLIYKIIGISTLGAPIEKRIKGLIRTFLGMLTLPFLIFDLPALIGKRTLKEILSGSSLRVERPILNRFSLFILFPLLFLPILFPTLEFDLTSAPQFEKLDYIRTRKLPKNKLHHFVAPFRSFQLTTNFSLNDKMFILPVALPQQDLFGLRIQYVDKKSFFQAHFLRKIDLTQDITTYLLENPFSLKMYPALQRRFLSQDLNNSKEVEAEFSELYAQSDLLFTPEKAIGLLFSNGPYIRPLASFHSKMKQAMGNPSSLAVFEKSGKRMNINILSNQKAILSVIQNEKMLLFNVESNNEKTLLQLSLRLFSQNSPLSTPDAVKNIDSTLALCDLLNSKLAAKAQLDTDEISQVGAFLTLYWNSLNDGLEAEQEKQGAQKLYTQRLGQFKEELVKMKLATHDQLTSIQ